LAIIVLTINQVLWLKFSSFTGSPIHPPPLGALTNILPVEVVTKTGSFSTLSLSQTVT
jgi:hypothetical protein